MRPNDQCGSKLEFTAGRIFADCVMCGVKMLKEDCTKNAKLSNILDCTKKCEGRINVKGYDKNDLEKVFTLSVTIDVLIKYFGEEKLSDDKKLEDRRRYALVKGNAQFVQKVTFEPLMDFKQNHHRSWKYYKSC